jgi:hypothetical protein
LIMKLVQLYGMGDATRRRPNPRIINLKQTAGRFELIGFPVCWGFVYFY